MVIYFAINYRQTRGSISPCDIAGFIWDVNPKKQPHKPPKFAVVDNPTVI